ncbi:MAG TPA: hypothetical protein VIJ04_18345 [Xanthobacteraceae bacterium]
MDDFEAKGHARQLRGWALSPEEPGSLKLVLQCEPDSDTAGDREALVQLLLPPEAALYLADELNRQAHRTLGEQTPKHPSADASGSSGGEPPSN